MSRAEWRDFMNSSPGMNRFRHLMFGRMVPNLREIGLLSKRILPHYERVGLAAYMGGLAADKLAGDQMIADLEAPRARMALPNVRVRETASGDDVLLRWGFFVIDADRGLY